MKNHLRLGLIAILALPACKKTATPTPVPGTTDVKIDTDVYIAGGYTAKNGNTVAAYWKNGVITKLSDSTKNTSTTGIAVDGSDVYISGNDNTTTRTPVYWKNDRQKETALTLPDTCNSAFASGIAVQNHNIYFSGSIYGTHNYPVYWQGSNAPVQLSQNTVSTANAITADGTGIYTASLALSGTFSVSAYWKNNGLANLCTNTSQYSEAYSITLNGTAVYTVGYTTTPNNNVATYWKNGVPIYLSDDSTNSYAYGIAVKDNVVYSSGYQVAANGHLIACYWKGRIRTDLSDYNQNTGANGIALVGNDVFISGSDYLNSKAVYWKNGNMHLLPGGNYAVSVVVVTHPH